MRYLLYAMFQQELGYSSEKLERLKRDALFAEVSKKEFAEAFFEGAHQEGSLALYALMLTSVMELAARKESPGLFNPGYKQLGGDFIYGLNPHQQENVLSGRGIPDDALQTGDFAGNPFTNDEMKALPYVAGFAPSLYALVDHDHGKHAQACYDKLMDAGYRIEAKLIADNPSVSLDTVHESHAKQSSQRWELHDEGPGL